MLCREFPFFGYCFLFYCFTVFNFTVFTFTVFTFTVLFFILGGLGEGSEGGVRDHVILLWELL
jgi:hypothetical protein